MDIDYDIQIKKKLSDALKKIYSYADLTHINLKDCIIIDINTPFQLKKNILVLGDFKIKIKYKERVFSIWLEDCILSEKGWLLGDDLHILN